MPSEMRDDADRDRRMGQILAAYLDALDAGQAPEREALLRQHPDLAGDLAEYFSQHDRFQHFVEPFRPIIPTDQPVPATQIDAEATGEHLAPGAGRLEPTLSAIEP